jgi:TatD DNase family protein
MIIDTHAHYDDEAFAADREEVFRSFPAGGIEMVLNAGASMDTSRRALQLAHEYPFLFTALGAHPNETSMLTEEDMDWLVRTSADPKVAAIGEIGLDYHFEEPVREIQKKWFARQIAAAKQARLPILVHSRDAAQDTLDLIRAEHAAEAGGVIHCFSYGTELARAYLDLGFYIGVGGVITFKNARRLKEVVAYAPLDRILLETDCPYLAPEPHRGTRNSSLYLPLVAQAIAGIRGITAEEVTEQTRKNALELFPKMKEYACRN